MMQPAVHRWAFSSTVPGRVFGKLWPNTLQGIYSRVPDYVGTPIAVFYSPRDVPLVYVYPVGFAMTLEEHALPRTARHEDAEAALVDMLGSNLPSAALGAHGPDMDDAPRVDRVLIQDLYGHGCGGQVRILGIKDSWGHGWGGRDGWGNDDTAQAVRVIMTRALLRSVVWKADNANGTKSRAVLRP
jgi:hypothetical protein